MEQENLGAKLRKIREDAQAAALNKEQARVRAAYEQSQQQRASIRDFWLQYVSHVVTQINQGKEPKARKVPDVFEQRVNASSYLITHELHNHHDMWLEIQSGAAKLGLVVCLTYNHDGYGETSWYEISVEPK